MLNFELFFKSFKDFIPSFLGGVGVTLLLALAGTVIGLIIGMFFSIVRTMKINEYDSKIVKIIKKLFICLIKIYVTIFRGTPMIVQATIFYFGFAAIGIHWSVMAAGLFTVSINTTAYLTEVLRGGIESVDPGQMEAARSIGMSNFKANMLVVFPQALRNSMASIGNEFIVNIKDTSVLSVIGVLDLYNISGIVGEKIFLQLEAMLVAAATYLFLTYTISKILQFIEKKMDLPLKDMTSSN